MTDCIKEISHKKKVSVIIPFYSEVDWLCEAVESALNQTYNNLEIIVINDGSPEDISGFLKKFGDKVVYSYKENGGSATARNMGLKLATGEYIAFLDSDDIWLPTKTEKQIEFMEECNAMWSHTGFYYWYPSSNRLKRSINNDDFGNIYKKIFVSIRIATPSVIVDKRVFEEHPSINFPVEYLKGQDTKFFHSLSKHYEIALLKEPLVKVRMRGNNSNTQPILRFNLKGDSYLKLKSNPDTPIGVKQIRLIYYIYSKIFGQKTNPLKDFIAKCFWAFPYSIERIYAKRIAWKIKKNKNYHKYIK